MILKGSTIGSVQHARLFARHLSKKENEVIQISSTDGAINQQDIEDDLVDMFLMTQITKGKRGIFHVAINPRKNETMSPKQWSRAVSLLEEEFGLSGQLRTQVYHEKENRPHLHVFWSLVDLEKETLIELKFYRRRLQRRATQMEKEFGHEITRRTANEHTIEITNADRMRKARTGKNPQIRKNKISEIWNQSITSFEFIDTLRSAGYQVIKGDRCKYGLIDQRNEVYNLVRQLPKEVKLKDVDQRLQIHYDQLLTKEQVLETRQQEREAFFTDHHHRKIDRQIQRIREKKKKYSSKQELER